MYHNFSLLCAISLYLMAGGILLLSIKNNSKRWQALAVISAFAGAIFHAKAQADHWLFTATPDLSILTLLSLCALVIVLILCASVLSKSPLFDASIVALPIAIVVLIAEWLIPSSALSLDHSSPGTTWHILSSILAFGVLSIAGVYAMFSALIDYFLRHHHLNPLVKSLPPLDVLEKLLIQLIATGFLLLTVSLLTGLAFVDDLFAQHLVHKTVLSITAWCLFGVLLWGRWRYGWRGRHAVRLTLVGFVLLLLAYFGSKVVLEIILDRSWQLSEKL